MRLIEFLKSYNFLLSIVLVGVISIIVFNHFVYDPAAKPSPVLTNLNNMQERTIDTLSGMTELLLTLATAVFAVIGYFIKEGKFALKSLQNKTKFTIILCLSFATLSIDFGYIYMEKWVELLANEMFVPYDPIVSVPRNLQFICFLISLIFLGKFVIQQLSHEDVS